MDRYEMKGEFVDWVFAHPAEGAALSTKDENHLRMENDLAKGEINFYDVGTAMVVELVINKKSDESNCFYLHFELLDLARAKELYREMTETFAELSESREVDVLLCCSSALTTTFFANKLNDSAKILSKEYSFSAASYDTLFEKADGATIILVAPQIAFHFDEIKSIYPQKIVVNVPPKIFAGYDAGKMIELIDEKLSEKGKESAVEQAEPKTVSGIEFDKKILSVAVYLNWKYVLLRCRIYEKGEVLHEENVIKKEFDAVRDICDILDTVASRKLPYDAASISIPGIIRDGHVDMPGYIALDVDLEALLNERYRVPVVLVNDVNAAVSGFYISQNDYHYDDISFLYQPKGFYGGVGTVIGGKVVSGKHKMAGEVKYLVDGPASGNGFEGVEDGRIGPQEIFDTVVWTFKTLIAIIDPEVLVLCCRYLPDVDRVREKLVETFPPNAIPPIIAVSEREMVEYMSLGAMHAGMEMAF